MRIDLGLRQSVTEHQARATDISQISHGLGPVPGRERNPISQSVMGVEREIYLF
jgi:hypothetical protein